MESGGLPFPSTGIDSPCFYGTEDAANICDRLALKGIRTIPIKSGHRFGRNYGAIVETILKELSLDEVRPGGPPALG